MLIINTFLLVFGSFMVLTGIYLLLPNKARIFVTALFLNQNTSQQALGMNGSQKNLPEGILRSKLRSSSLSAASSPEAKKVGVGLLLAGVLALVLIVTIYTSQKTRQIAPSALPQSVSPATSATSASDDKYVPRPADPNKEYIFGGYYYAKDLGIRFKITNELITQKLISGYKELTIDKSKPVTKSLVLSTQFLSDATNNCSIQKGALGELWRGEGKYEEVPSNTLIKQFDVFFIAYNNGGYNCTFESKPEIQEAHNQAGVDLQNAIKNVEELKD